MSKGLVALNEIRDNIIELNNVLKDFGIDIFNCNKQCKNCSNEKCKYKIIEKELTESQIKETFINSIKAKRINLIYFVGEVRPDIHKMTYEDYIGWARFKVKSNEDILTREEFSLWKEVLENE